MFGGGYCGPMGLGGWVLMIGFWVILIAAVLWAATRLFPAAERSGELQAVLDRRLAAGEIDPHAYEALRAQLVAAERYSRNTALHGGRR